MRVVLVLALLSAPAVAQDTGKNEKANDPVVCRRETPIGSRVPGPRTCMKRSEWVAKSTKVDQDGRTLPQWQGGSGYSPRAN